MMQYHLPALLFESIEGLKIKPEGTYIDATFGGGGHSKEILKHITTGKLYSFDQDNDVPHHEIQNSQFEFIPENFKNAFTEMEARSALPVDGIIADLGVSWHQFDNPERGFSTRFDSALDMRMRQNKNIATAAEILNSYSEQELIYLFRNYGELENAGKLSREIIKKRTQRPIEKTSELIAISEQCYGKFKSQKLIAQVFQALRIEVNNEKAVLKDFLRLCEKMVVKGGRVAIISYHSLEDRLVKNYFRTGNMEGKEHKDLYGNPITPFNTVNKKVIVPTIEEVKNNPRARSAKLRIAEKR
jgi:16S rRNA (cytosine1402-N4)-methyltransferase